MPRLVSVRYRRAGRQPRPVVVVSPMRIYREGLAHVLAQREAIRVVGGAARIDELASILMAAEVDVVLFDLAWRAAWPLCGDSGATPA